MEALTNTPVQPGGDRYADRLIKLMAEMGLTPSSRSRIVVPKQEDEDDPMAQLLARMGSGHN